MAPPPNSRSLLQEEMFGSCCGRTKEGGKLRGVSASYHSVRGMIRSAWKRGGDGGKQLTLNVSIPANTTATVYLPATTADSVMESGKPLKSGQGLALQSFANHEVCITAGAGEYEFRTELP